MSVHTFVGKRRQSATAPRPAPTAARPPAKRNTRPEISAGPTYKTTATTCPVCSKPIVSVANFCAVSHNGKPVHPGCTTATGRELLALAEGAIRRGRNYTTNR